MVVSLFFPKSDINQA